MTGSEKRRGECQYITTLPSVPIFIVKYLLVHASQHCMVLRYYSVLLPYSFSVCEQAEKLDVLDYALSVTSMSASIGQ